MQKPSYRDTALSFLPWPFLFLTFFYTSRQNYLLFHSLVELFSIVVSCSIFMLTWNARHYIYNTYILFIGIASLFIGFFDSLHLLAYEGIGIFKGNTSNLATQLWLITRYLKSVSFVIAPLMLKRSFSSRAILGIFSLSSVLALYAIFSGHILPDAFVEGSGLTLFKKVSEYIICVLFVIGILFLVNKRSEFSDKVFRMLAASIIFGVFAELTFTLYSTVQSDFNFLGHFLEVISVFLIYKAIIQTGLISPYELLFRELKSSEETIRIEKNKAQAYLDIAQVILVAVDENYRIVLINKMGCDILGYPEKDLLGKSWLEYFGPEEDKQTAASFMASLIAGHDTPQNVTFQLKDGNRAKRLICWNFSVLKTEPDKTSILFCGEDITESHQTKEAILRAKKDWEMTFDSVSDLIAIIDPEYTILRTNKAMADKFGMTPQELKGRKCYELFHQTSEPISLCPHTQTIADGDEHDLDLFEQTLEGHFHVTTSPLVDVDNEIVATVHVAHDITSLKIAEEKLQAAKDELEKRVAERTAELTQTNINLTNQIKEREAAQIALQQNEEKFKRLSQEFNTLLDAIPDALLLFSPDLRVLWANKGAAVIFNGTMESLLNKYCHELMGTCNRQCERCPLKQAFEKAAEQSNTFTTADNRLLQLRAFPMMDEAPGKVRNVILLCIDITDKTKLEVEAMRNRHLTSLGELAAGVAHEINNPINGIINYAQLIANKTDKTSREHDISRRIIREGDRIATIVKSLLSFARADKDDKRPVHVLEILDDALALTGKQLRNDHILLEIDIPDSTPKVLANPHKIAQVFLNLIMNARYALNKKYPGSDEDKILGINTSLIDDNGVNYLRIIFHDHGTGISQPLMDKIMNPFFTTKPGGQGTGLGLSISHGIIKDHNGNLTIESEVEQYTKMIIDLPVQENT